ncbi:citrulline utilization hydrolase CtlX [Mucilaginibacter terrae]|uniref:citrulline utilization hydrolase CtlX n=1 Tax=Mucilaginibacter terrae TaxID=1955052 RepID=UPI0036318FBD
MNIETAEIPGNTKALTPVFKRNAMTQVTSHLLMIRPASFGFNEQTAESNAFQQKGAYLQKVQQKALLEFDTFVELLQSYGVDITVIQDTEDPKKPDAIFPNNWVSFHNNGDVIIYPMQAPNRRWERNEEIISRLRERFKMNHVIDLSSFEAHNKFLEGTGSMVLDRENKIAYACLSPRTDAEVLDAFCRRLNYKAISFNATDAKQKTIYHTNVMMCLGSRFAVICLDSIQHTVEKEIIKTSLTNTNKEIIAITLEQMNNFAGNMLEVQNKDGQSLLIMSRSAHQSLTVKQVQSLKQYSQIISANLSTIETIGGGSARCMIAEIHLPIV